MSKSLSILCEPCLSCWSVYLFRRLYCICLCFQSLFPVCLAYISVRLVCVSILLASRYNKPILHTSLVIYSSLRASSIIYILEKWRFCCLCEPSKSSFHIQNINIHGALYRPEKDHIYWDLIGCWEGRKKINIRQRRSIPYLSFVLKKTPPPPDTKNYFLSARWQCGMVSLIFSPAAVRASLFYNRYRTFLVKNISCIFLDLLWFCDNFTYMKYIVKEFVNIILIFMNEVYLNWVENMSKYNF